MTQKIKDKHTTKNVENNEMELDNDFTAYNLIGGAFPAIQFPLMHLPSAITRQQYAVLEKKIQQQQQNVSQQELRNPTTTTLQKSKPAASAATITTNQPNVSGENIPPRLGELQQLVAENDSATSENREALQSQQSQATTTPSMSRLEETLGSTASAKGVISNHKLSRELNKIFKMGSQPLEIRKNLNKLDKTIDDNDDVYTIIEEVKNITGLDVTQKGTSLTFEIKAIIPEQDQKDLQQAIDKKTEELNRLKARAGSD